MAKLADIQTLLSGAFRGFTPLQEQRELHDALLQCVSGNDRLTPLEQADIYRRQFWLRHRDILREDFPTLRYWLEEDGFNAFCQAYLTAHPPSSYTLRDLGDRLALFAASYPDFVPDRAAVARDLATFELAFVKIFDGPDVPPISDDPLSGLPPEAWLGARLLLHPVLRLLTLDYPVYRLRRAIRADEEPERSLAAEPTCLAMWRGEDFKVSYRIISTPERRLLGAVREGMKLAAACECAVADLSEEQQTDVASRIGRWFQGWAMRGWVVGVEVNGGADSTTVPPQGAPPTK